MNIKKKKNVVRSKRREKNPVLLALDARLPVKKVITSLESCLFTEVLNKRNTLASPAWCELGETQSIRELTTP